MSEPSEPVYEFGEFRLDSVNKALLRNGLPVSLTPKVFDTLKLLVVNAGQLVEKDQFLQQLWPGTFIEESAIAENISRLRRALGDTEGQRFIVTVPKRGYRFVASVKTLFTSDERESLSSVPAKASTVATNANFTALAAPTSRPETTPALAVPPASTPRSGTAPTPPATALEWRRWSLVLVGMALLALGGAYFDSYRRSPLFSSSPAVPIRSLAVLPLENLSRDPEQEYFADGMTDELITQLSQIRALRVISRTSIMRYKGTRKPLGEIARELDVDAVVEGTVLRSAERVRVTAQVVGAGPERHIWAESYDRPLGDAVILQGELARQMAQAIRIKLTPQELTRLVNIQSVDPEAHEAFLKGRYFWSKRTEATTRKAIEYFQLATEKNPNYALAYTGLADSYISLALPEALQEALPPNEAFPKARAAVDRALEIDPTLAEAHASLAHIKFQYERDWSGAEKEFQLAITLNPNYANAHHWYALTLMWRGGLDEALTQIKQARELDPLSLVINANLGFILAGAQQYNKAIEQCRKTLEMDPNFALAHYRLGQIYILNGMNTEAIPELESALALSGGSPRATAELGLAYARTGRRSHAVKLLNDLKAQAKERYVSPFDFAVIYGGLGEKNQTLEWLEKADEERSTSLNLLKMSPAFSSLQSEPRFVRLVGRISLPP
jgi:TolB-like protein/DNA-binding winged helix-turn-helix (wHTH) protein/Flp pilus assembly protein TadD